ncbi:hypothetical protein KGD82_16560 [Nocardiopsis eucommiae]|uniref:Uncharacterized protein n=1 Tax=Nocardiopsis eucommiae TaxID=2831970 RepID=A0A975L817_9ACTN|nr:hypothetical protein KGD82_16560 [Nocardiopsis eucommiae]
MSWKAAAITALILVGGTGFFAGWAHLAAAAIRTGDPLIALAGVVGPLIAATALLAGALWAQPDH